MNRTLHILLLLLLLLFRRFAAAPAPYEMHTRSSPACSDELVTFSLCLPFVAVAPNNLTDTPPPQCCEDVSAALGNGSAICLCYFMRRPKLLGFPLNLTRILSLTSVCLRNDRNFQTNFTLETLCSGLVTLPPLQSITGLSNSMPRNSGAYSPPPPLIGSPPKEESAYKEPANELPSEPSLPTITTSPATLRTYRLSKTSLISLFTILLLYQLRVSIGHA